VKILSKINVANVIILAFNVIMAQKKQFSIYI